MMLKIANIKRRIHNLIKFAENSNEDKTTGLGPAEGMAPLSGWLPAMTWAPAAGIGSYEAYRHVPAFVGNTVERGRAAKSFEDAFVKTPVATATKSFVTSPGSRNPVDLSRRQSINDDNLREAFSDLADNPDSFWNASPVGDIKRMHHQAVIMQALLDNPSRFGLTGDAGSIFENNISDRTRRTLGQLAFGAEESFIPRGSIFPENAQAGGLDIPIQDFWGIIRNPRTSHYRPAGVRPHPLIDKRRDLDAAVREFRRAIGRNVPQIDVNGNNVVITRPTQAEIANSKRSYVRGNTSHASAKPRGRAAAYLELAGLLSSLYGIGGQMWNNRSGTTTIEPVVENETPKVTAKPDVSANAVNNK